MHVESLKALPGKLDIKRHSSSILYLSGGLGKSQSHTADQPMALRARDTEHQQPYYRKKTIKAKQPALSLSQPDNCKPRKEKYFITKQNKHKTSRINDNKSDLDTIITRPIYLLTIKLLDWTNNCGCILVAMHMKLSSNRKSNFFLCENNFCSAHLKYINYVLSEGMHVFLLLAFELRHVISNNVAFWQM